MAIWTNETETRGASPMASPSVNVSLTGQVPTQPITFRLDLPCLGTRNAEVDVILNINVTSPRHKRPPTVLYFKRRKICLKGKSAQLFAPHQQVSEATEAEGTSLTLIYYLVPSLMGFTLVLLSIILLLYIRNRTYKRQTNHTILNGSDVVQHGEKIQPLTNSTLLGPSTPNKNTYTLPSSITINSYASLHKLASTTPLISGHDAYSHTNTSASFTHCSSKEACQSSLLDKLASSTPLTSGHTYSHTSTSASVTHCSSRESGSKEACQSSSSLSRSEVVVDPSAAEVHERFRQMEVERQRVRLTAVVHEGSFGRVFRGWIQRDHPEQDQQVLIKTVTEGTAHEEIVTLYREGTHLFNLYHRNILTMVGISFADNSSPFLIYPFHGYQNLKQYLKEHRGGHLRAAELVELAVQAAHGLSFLHTANILHGDIAARNCVVSEKLQLRITDAALARDLFTNDYECVGEEMTQPIKWMAYEVITEKLISTASDVWSYGVLLWELTTLAGQPYVEVASCEMGEYLRDGYRLAQPLNCPDDLYKVMAFCWAIHPHDRPHAKLILDYLDAFNKQLNDYI